MNFKKQNVKLTSKEKLSSGNKAGNTLADTLKAKKNQVPTQTNTHEFHSRANIRPLC